MLINITQTKETKSPKGADCLECTGITRDGKPIIFYSSSRQQNLWDSLSGQEWDVDFKIFGGSKWAQTINPYHSPDSKLVQEAKKLGAVPVEPTPQVTQSKSAPFKASGDKMSKEEWKERDEETRISIQRQTALKTAAENAPEKSTSEDIIKVAKRFAKYLETGE